MFYGLVIVGHRADNTIVTVPHRHDNRNCWLVCIECQKYETFVQRYGHRELKEAQEI